MIKHFKVKLVFAKTPEKMLGSRLSDLQVLGKCLAHLSLVSRHVLFIHNLQHIPCLLCINFMYFSAL